MSDFKERLKVEAQENSQKIEKLKLFLVDDGFKCLCKHHQDLLEFQLLAMHSLDIILRKRLELLE